MKTQETTPITETAAPAQEPSFEVQQARTDDMEVAEFDTVPLTDINFGF